MNRRHLTLFAAAIAMLSSGAFAQTPSGPVVRLRGTIVSAATDSIVVQDRNSGEKVTLALSPTLTISEVYPIKLEDIKPNSFIGTAARPQLDGTQRAIAVTVFPESARGTGEGFRPFDLQPDSTMTNATVADVMTAPTGRTLSVQYKGGEKTIVVPVDAPVVTFRPAGRELLVPGASVSLVAQEIAGTPTASRINAGKDGFALPY